MSANDTSVTDMMAGSSMDCSLINSGDTAWMTVATAFVLFMTPGLAFFYGGLVPRKSVVTIVMQCMISMGVTAMVWALIGFSLAYGSTLGSFIGNPGSYPLFIGLDFCMPWPGTRIPSLLFATYQMMFAIIAPALITGAFADRVLFPAYIVFLILWVPLVYCPFCHWIWNAQGFLAKWGVADFAGGIVVHISAGFAALASIFVVGAREFESEEHRITSTTPHNRTFVALGAGMLWMGWFGFNGGSSFNSGAQSTYAIANSTLAASAAMCVWLAIDWHHTGKPQLVGSCIGAVAGLATVTPAAGFVRPWAAILIGMVASPFCYGCVSLQYALKWDDALEVWGVHGMGGFLGSVLNGALADNGVGIFQRSGVFFGKQLAACLFTSVYAFVVSYALLKAIGAVMPLVPPAPMILEGLDITMHGEHAYDQADAAAGGKGMDLNQSISNLELYSSAAPKAAAPAAVAPAPAEVSPSLAAPGTGAGGSKAAAAAPPPVVVDGAAMGEGAKPGSDDVMRYSMDAGPGGPGGTPLYTPGSAAQSVESPGTAATTPATAKGWVRPDA